MTDGSSTGDDAFGNSGWFTVYFLDGIARPSVNVQPGNNVAGSSTDWPALPKRVCRAYVRAGPIFQLGTAP